MKKLTLILLSFCILTSLFAQEHTELEKEIQAIIKNKKATVGVAVIFDDNTTLTINNDYHYPTMSVFKLPLALAVLDYIDKNNISLESEIFIKKSDLLTKTHSPLRDKYPNGDLNASIKDLITYTIAQSDNNATDILLTYIGGPQVVDAHVKKLGITDIEIVANEATMNKSPEDQYLNWTTPSASTLLLEVFLRKNLFSDAYKNFLIETLISTTTGTDKIKGALPQDAIVGHKTGSSSRNDFGIKIGENDLGFVKLPNGKQFSIGVFVMNSMESDETNASIISNISKAIYDYYNK